MLRTITMAAVLATTGVAACTGSIPSSPSSTPSGSTGSQAGPGGSSPGPGAGPGPVIPSGPGTVTPPLPATCAPVVGAAPMRRLTRDEYDNTLRDLLGVTNQPGAAFQTDEAYAGFATNSTTPTSRLAAERYMDAAEAVASAAPLGKLVPCDVAKGNDTCARGFVEAFGKRAFRRALAKNEVDGLLALHQDKTKRGGFEPGVRLVVAALLQSPSFLYRADDALPTAKTAALTPAGAYALASRLSYFLWASMPDDKLLLAAESGALGDKAKLDAEVRRMMADPKAADAFRSFHLQWLGVSRIASAEKDERRYPEWTAPLKDAMKAETIRFVDDLFTNGQGRFDGLLTSTTSFVDAQLAKLYGVKNAPASGFARAELPATERAGALTQAAFLAMQSLPDQPSPIHRGLFVRERMLCGHVPAPPSGVDISPPVVSDDASTRQRFEQHRADPSCRSCHELFDPIGFGFQHYDGLGRYQTREGKNGEFPVDARGEIKGAGPDVDGTFTGALELSRRLAGSATVQACFVRQWFRFGLGREETASESCLIDAIATRFAAAKLDARELIIAIATSDEFRLRAGN